MMFMRTVRAHFLRYFCYQISYRTGMRNARGLVTRTKGCRSTITTVFASILMSRVLILFKRWRELNEIPKWKFIQFVAKWRSMLAFRSLLFHEAETEAAPTSCYSSHNTQASADLSIANKILLKSVFVHYSVHVFCNSVENRKREQKRKLREKHWSHRSAVG